MAAGAMGTFSTRFQGAGPGVTAGVPALLEDRERQQSLDLRLALMCSHTRWITHRVTPSLPRCARGTQHELNSSTAHPPSDGLVGYNWLCSSHLESLGCWFQLHFFNEPKDGYGEVRCSAKRSPILVKWTFIWNCDTWKNSSWLSGRISSLKGLLSIGMGCPGKWWCCHPWKCLRNDWTCHLVLRFSWQSDVQSKGRL